MNIKKKVMDGLIPTKDFARQFVHIFVNQPQLLINFLEYIAEKGEATPVTYNTLLELYLRDNGKDKELKRQKALDLLKPENKIDHNQALLLCQMHNFKKGQIQLLESMELYNEILQIYMDDGDHDNILRSCKKKC